MIRLVNGTGRRMTNHLNKHAMHLIRLFMMAIDILEKEEIITYRKDEHELLMKIRRENFRRRTARTGRNSMRFWLITRNGFMRRLRTHRCRTNRIMSVCRNSS